MIKNVQRTIRMIGRLKSMAFLTSLNKEIRTKLGWVKRKFFQAYYGLLSPQIITIRGIRLQLGSHISETIRDVIYRGDYEGPELRIARSKLHPDDVVMEIGAGLGFLSTYCAKQIGDNKVFTYEANPQLEPHILQTYKLNRVNPTLEICLVGEGNGEKDFFLSKDFWQSSTILPAKSSKKVTVPVKDFNQEIHRINPTFLIIDIEEGEYDLLHYADFHNVRKLLIEIHPSVLGREKFEWVKQKILEAGFYLNQELSCTQEFFFQRK